MNKVILAGRLGQDAKVSYGQGEKASAVARFSLAVPRKFKRQDGSTETDFISCVAFGSLATFLEQYGTKGTKFIIEGRIQTGNYTNKEGAKVYTTDVVVESIEFAESKKGGSSLGESAPETLMEIPDDIDLEVPFN